jgi:signal transduction histidine kinase
VKRAVSRIARSAATHHFSTKLTPIRVAADPEAIDRIVGNLVSNAVRYTPDGSNITVELTVDGDIEPIAIITVSDDGPGMSDADAARAFDRFHRGDTSRGTGGSGLGLAIVEQAARSHRGSVELNTAPGQGCAFIVKIPVES